MHFHLQETFLFQLQLRRGFDHLFWIFFFITANRYKEGYWKGRPKEILSHSISGYKRICALWGHIYLQTWHFACPLSGTVSVVYHIDTDVVEIGHLFITEKCCRNGKAMINRHWCSLYNQDLAGKGALPWLSCPSVTDKFVCNDQVYLTKSATFAPSVGSFISATTTKQWHCSRIYQSDCLQYIASCWNVPLRTCKRQSVLWMVISFSNWMEVWQRGLRLY